MNLTQVQTKITDFFVTYGFQTVGAIIILVIGVLIANWIGRLLYGWLGHLQLEPPVRQLLVRVAKLIIVVFALVLVASNLGVNTAPLVAGIGVVGVGIGLATQGVLSNLVAGLLIIFTKPFRVGEYIELIGVEGQVTSIELFATTLTHPDLSLVVIPNRKIAGEVLHNYGAIRQLNLTVNVAYRTDVSKLETILRDILSHNKRVLKEPAPVFGLSQFGDSAVAVSIKPWVVVNDYGAAQAELNRTLIERFRAEGIEIPFPQREVRLLNAVA